MTRAELVVLRDAAQAAYTRALDAAQYSVSSGGGNRSITRQKLESLRAEWEYWQARIDVVDGTSRRIKFATPRY